MFCKGWGTGSYLKAKGLERPWGSRSAVVTAEGKHGHSSCMLHNQTQLHGVGYFSMSVTWNSIFIHLYPQRKGHQWQFDNGLDKIKIVEKMLFENYFYDTVGE